jgi:hypothetical protein
LQTDKQFLDGVNRQLKTIKQYCRQYLQSLQERKSLTRDFTGYKNIYHMLQDRHVGRSASWQPSSARSA